LARDKTKAAARLERVSGMKGAHREQTLGVLA
jgi:hypothetical protein